MEPFYWEYYHYFAVERWISWKLSTTIFILELLKPFIWKSAVSCRIRQNIFKLFFYLIFRLVSIKESVLTWYLAKGKLEAS